MTELGNVLGHARWAVGGRMQIFLRCLVLASMLLHFPYEPSWGAPDDHGGATSPAVPGAAAVDDAALIGAIRDLTNSAQALGQPGDFDAASLRQFYAERDYRPLWVGTAELHPQGKALLGTLERLERSGTLSPGGEIAGASARRG